MTEKNEKPKLTDEQKAILEFNKKNLIVSASAGSGKTFVVIEYLKQLLVEKHIPLSKMLVLTFTKAAAGEMKSRLSKAILECDRNDFLTQQLDEISLADISTIHAFCEKLLKRYTGIVPVAQNFVVLDEKESWALKNRAFKDAFELFSQSDDEDFDAFYNAFKKNKDLMLQCVEALAVYLESQKEGEALADEFINKYDFFTRGAEEYLNAYLKEELRMATALLSKSNYQQMEECYCQYGDNLSRAVKVGLDENFALNCKAISQIDIGRMPTKKTAFEFEKEMLWRAKERFANLQKLVSSYDIYSETFSCEEKNNFTAKALVKLFKQYRKNYIILKSQRRALDFSDLERNAQILLQNENILKDLQERYAYIFIDEYQDTNPLQESFVKSLAGKGRFIAVGDPKQGIYGFRNASMEIMKKDIETFSASQDADALFLNGNFRSDDHILQFVNTIFNHFMTEESVGINYEKTSKLKGLTEFKNDGFKPVEVSIITPAQEEALPAMGVYSVKDDGLKYDEKNLLEIMTIVSHIEKYLSGSIYDAKKKEFRGVNESDIVVLFRKRGPLMERLASYLQTMGHEVVADYSKPLLDNGEIASIVSFVRLALSLDDEVSLASAMSSAVGGFTPEELTLFKAEKDKTFMGNVLSSQSEKVDAFFEKIKRFKTGMDILGLGEALKKLLDENYYYVYLDTLESGGETKGALSNLFKVIKSGDYDFNPQGLIDFLDEKKPMGGGGGGSNAITLTTIHATKGLEFPIVILAGCGDNMGKTDISPVNFSQAFGIGTNLYDFDNNLKLPSLAKMANKLSKQKKEYIDELMILYVALTRAQNHLVLTGTITGDGLKKWYLNKTYLSLVLNAFGENFASQVFEEGKVEKENVTFSLVDSGEEKTIEIRCESGALARLNIDEINDYINFVYPDKDAGRRYKNSVTSLMDESTDAQKQQMLAMDAVQNRDEAIESGNAYHEALKILPFEKIKGVQDIDRLLERDQLADGHYEKIDKNLLFKNILIIKSVLGNQTPIKEREFIMSCSLNELGLSESEDKVIVQGIVDLFSMGEKNILIDYKYTSQKNPEKIVKKYLCQIKLYQKALEKAFGKKIDEKYILSLKDALLIKIEG